MTGVCVICGDTFYFWASSMHPNGVQGWCFDCAHREPCRMDRPLDEQVGEARERQTLEVHLAKERWRVMSAFTIGVVVLMALVLVGCSAGGESFDFGPGSEGRVFEVATVGSDKVVRVRRVR